MNPVPAREVSRPSEVERKVLCTHYGGCLEITLQKNWKGFSCSDCQDFEFECQGDLDHWNDQGEKSRMILLDAGYTPRWLKYRARNSVRQ